MPRIWAALRMAPILRRAARRRLKARDLTIAPQAANLICGETFARGRFASLTIEDSGDDFIGIKSGQPAKQGEGIFVGAWAHGFESRNRTSSLVIMPPRQRSVRSARPSARLRFRITSSSSVRRSSLRSRSVVVGAVQTVPQIGAEPLKRFQLRGSERGGALLFASAQFRFGVRRRRADGSPIRFPDRARRVGFRDPHGRY